MPYLIDDPYDSEFYDHDFIAWHHCAMECGNKIENHQDDVGAFYVETPNHGYAAICKTCWDSGGYTTCER